MQLIFRHAGAHCGDGWGLPATGHARTPGNTHHHSQASNPLSMALSPNSREYCRCNSTVQSFLSERQTNRRRGSNTQQDTRREHAGLWSAPSARIESAQHRPPTQREGRSATPQHDECSSAYDGSMLGRGQQPSPAPGTGARTTQAEHQYSRSAHSSR